MSKPNHFSTDYLIVGAVSAGCVLAQRLSADPSIRVVLIEAGVPDRHPLIKIPAAFSKLYRSRVDYAYQSVAQPELGGRSLFMPRGRTLGGSGAINAMIYIRGTARILTAGQLWAIRAWDMRIYCPFFKKVWGYGILKSRRIFIP